MKKFEKKNIDVATPDEIRAYAVQFLGIIDTDANDDEILAKVRAATEGKEIFVATAPEETDQAGSNPRDVEGRGGGLVGSFGRDDPKVRLTIHAEERDGVVVNRHKEVAVNGVAYLLKRGESIEIPYRYFLALENAERDSITHTSEGEVRTQKVKNTPYNVERMPSPEEIKAWHERTDALFVP